MKNSSQNRATYEIILERMKEKDITKEELAEETGIKYETLRGYLQSGSNIPKGKLQLIANVLEVQTSYLLGETETKNLKEIENYDLYGEETQELIKEKFKVTPLDIHSFITNDTQFWDIFFLEVTRVMEYHTNNSYSEQFEDFFNSTEINTKYFGDKDLDKNLLFGDTILASTPYKVSIATFSKAILSKKIGMMFDEYIEIKLKEIKLKEKEEKG